MAQLKLLSKHPWAIFFVFTLVAWLLQAIPPIGIFMMVLMAPLWPVVTIDLGFFLLALAAFNREVPRLMLILPIMWFGGYFASAAYSHWVVWRIAEQIRTENAAATLVFDRRHTDVVIPSGAGLEPLTLDYDLDGLFTAEKSCGGFLRSIVTPGQCASQNRNVSGCPELTLPWRSKSAIELCWRRAAGSPTRGMMTIEVDTEAEDTFWHTGQLRRFSVISPNGRVVTVRAGSVAPLAWLPMPIAGCFLVSGPSTSWECFATWGRSKAVTIAVGPTGNDGVDVVANLLGLQLR